MLFKSLTIVCLLTVFIIFNSCENSTEIGNDYPNTIHEWVNVNNNLPSGIKFTITSVAENLYLITGTNLFRSSNNGETWENMNSTFPDSSGIHLLSGTDSYLVAANFGSGVFVSNDLGKTWIKQANISLGGTTKYIHSILATNDYLYIGAGNDAIVYRSSDLGLNWAPHSDGLPITTPIYYPRILTLLKNENYLYACPFESGVYISRDNGITWESMNNGFPDSRHVSNLAISNSAFLAQTFADQLYKSGLYKRAFNDSTWIQTPVKVTNSGLHFVLTRNNVVLASTNSGIDISFNNGETWNRCTQGLDNSIFPLYDDNAVVHGDYFFMVNNYETIWRYSLR